MKDAPAFDFYAQRWLAGTASLTAEERGAYIQLLAEQWEQDGLPNDMKRLSAVARCRSGALAVVLDKFPVCEDGRRRNFRLEVTRAEQRARIETSRRKIEKMNAARASCRDSTRPSTRGSTSTLQNGPQERSCRPPSPIHHSPHVLLEKEPKPREARQSPSDSQAQQDAEAANAAPIPANLERMGGFDDFRQVWGDWCCYRTERAVTGLKAQRLPWTLRAAQNTLAEVLRIAMSLGLRPITARCREAMASSWKGLNLGTMPMPTNGGSTSRPSQPELPPLAPGEPSWGKRVTK